jgi:hypothetical protein
MSGNANEPLQSMRTASEGLGVASVAKAMNASCDIQFPSASCTDVEKCFKDVP